MSKNIKISNIDSDKLLNGEMNADGIKINSEFMTFNENGDYDCVYATLDVDNTNTAIKPSSKPSDWNQESWNNWEKTIPLNVYVRKNGITTKVDRLITPEYPQQYNDRVIDNAFPFNQIKRVVKINWRNNCNNDTIEEEEFPYECLNQIYSSNGLSVENVDCTFTVNSAAISYFNNASDNSIEFDYMFITLSNNYQIPYDETFIKQRVGLYSLPDDKFVLILRKNIPLSTHDVTSIIKIELYCNGIKYISSSFPSKNANPYWFMLVCSLNDSYKRKIKLKDFSSNFEPFINIPANRFFEAENLHAVCDNKQDKRIDNKIFVKIPKYYNRTSFYKTKTGYQRKYEIISPEVYETLDDKRGFFVPLSFKDKNEEIKDHLYISAFPESESNVTSLLGGDLNYIPAELLPYKENPYFTKPFLMNAETWYGVLCYLFRIYSGYVNPIQTTNSFKTKSFYDLEQPSESKRCLFTTYTDNLSYNILKYNTEGDLVFNISDGSIKFYFSNSFKCFFSDITTDLNENGYIIKHLDATYIDEKSIRLSIPLSEIQNDGNYFINRLQINGDLFDIQIPITLSQTNSYVRYKKPNNNGYINIRFYGQTTNDLMLMLTSSNNMFNSSGTDIVRFELWNCNNLLDENDINSSVSTISNLIDGRCINLNLNLRPVNSYYFFNNNEQIKIIAMLSSSGNNIIAKKGFWFIFDEKENKIVTDEKELYNLMNELDDAITNQNLKPSLTLCTNDSASLDAMYGNFSESKYGFVNPMIKNSKYKNKFSILWFSNLFSNVRYDFRSLPYIKHERRKEYGGVIPSFDFSNDKTWFYPYMRYYNNVPGIYIENLNLGLFERDNIQPSIGEEMPSTVTEGYFNFIINEKGTNTKMSYEIKYPTQDNIVEQFFFSIKKFACDDISILDKKNDDLYYYYADKSFYELPLEILNKDISSRDEVVGSSFYICQNRSDDSAALRKNKNICSVGSQHHFEYTNSYFFSDVNFKPKEDTTFDLYAINVYSTKGVGLIDDCFFLSYEDEHSCCYDQNIFICFVE